MKWTQLLALGCAACGPVVDGESEGQEGGSSPGSSTETSSGTGASSGNTMTGPSMSTTTGTSRTESTEPPQIFDLAEPGDLPPQCAFWASQGCGTLREPTVSGTVITTQGVIEVSHAYFGGHSLCGSCVDEPNVATISFLPAPAGPGMEPLSMDDGLTLSLDRGDPFTGPLGETVANGNLEAYRGGSFVQTSEAMFSINEIPIADELAEPFDPDAAVTIAGTLEVDTDGWFVSLEFEAAYCPDMNRSAICE